MGLIERSDQVRWVWVLAAAALATTGCGKRLVLGTLNGVADGGSDSVGFDTTLVTGTDVVSDAGGDPSSVSHSDAAAGTSDVSPTAPTSDGSNHTAAEDADGGEHSDDDESDEPDQETEREGTDDFAETDELEPADHEGESTELEAADSPDETEPPQSSSLETGDLDDVTSEAP